MYAVYEIASGEIKYITSVQESVSDGFGIIEIINEAGIVNKKVVDGNLVEKDMPAFSITKEIAEYIIQEHLNNIARSYGYDNILSACSYAGYENPYQDESKRFIKWRGSVWYTAYQVLQEVENGDREPPSSKEELIALLPKFEDITLEE